MAVVLERLARLSRSLWRIVRRFGWLPLLGLGLLPTGLGSVRCHLWRLIGLELRCIMCRLRRLGLGVALLRIARLIGVRISRIAVWRGLLRLMGLVPRIRVMPLRIEALLSVPIWVGLAGLIGLLRVMLLRLLIVAWRTLPVACVGPPRGGVRWTGVACHDRNIPSPVGQNSTSES